MPGSGAQLHIPFECWTMALKCVYPIGVKYSETQMRMYLNYYTNTVFDKRMGRVLLLTAGDGGIAVMH